VVFLDEDGIMLGEIACYWMPLGTLLPGDEMEVVQSYHLAPETGNAYQGDVVTFNIQIYGEQKLGSGPGETREKKLFLDDKTGDPDWYFIPNGRWGLLDYNAAGPTFDYALTAQGLNPSTAYCLVYYADPWPGTGGFDIECGSSDAAGKLSMSGSKDIGSIPVAGDANPGAKMWLVLDSDYDETADKMVGWNPSQYLFESHLITYTETV
jgi:hypothetical protein